MKGKQTASVQRPAFHWPDQLQQRGWSLVVEEMRGYGSTWTQPAMTLCHDTSSLCKQLKNTNAFQPRLFPAFQAGGIYNAYELFRAITPNDCIQHILCKHEASYVNMKNKTDSYSTHLLIKSLPLKPLSCYQVNKKDVYCNYCLQLASMWMSVLNQKHQNQKYERDFRNIKAAVSLVLHELTVYKQEWVGK